MNFIELKSDITQIKKNLRKSFVAVKGDISKLKKTDSKFIGRFRDVESKINNCSTKKYVTETLLKNNYNVENKINKINQELRNRESLKREFKILKKVEDKVKKLNHESLSEEEFSIFKDEIIDELEVLKEELREVKDKAVSEMDLNKELAKIRASQKRMKRSIEDLDDIRDEIELNDKIHKEIKKLNKKADLLLSKQGRDLTSDTLVEIEKKSFWEKIIEFFSEEEEEPKKEQVKKLDKNRNKKVSKKAPKR